MLFFIKCPKKFHNFNYITVYKKNCLHILRENIQDKIINLDIQNNILTRLKFKTLT